MRLDESISFWFAPAIDIESFGYRPRDYLLACGLVPAHIEHAYEAILNEALTRTASAFELAGNYALIRLHGDCHPSNILWTQTGPHFVDLDDCRKGPAVQDLWMLLSGERDERNAQLAQLLTGYLAIL